MFINWQAMPMLDASLCSKNKIKKKVNEVVVINITFSDWYSLEM